MFTSLVGSEELSRDLVPVLGVELPGHPVGTPFPGGFIVEERVGVYYCPVREKEDEVETSICPYCPAEQSALPGDETV